MQSQFQFAIPIPTYLTSGFGMGTFNHPGPGAGAGAGIPRSRIDSHVKKTESVSKEIVLSIPENSDPSIFAIIYRVSKDFEPNKIDQERLSELQRKYFNNLKNSKNRIGEFYLVDNPSEGLKKLVSHLRPYHSSKILTDESRALHDTVWAVIFDGEKINHDLVNKTSQVYKTTTDNKFCVAMNPRIAELSLITLKQKLLTFKEEDIQLNAPKEKTLAKSKYSKAVLKSSSKPIKGQPKVKSRYNKTNKRFWPEAADRKLIEVVNKYGKKHGDEGYLKYLKQIDEQFAKVAKMRLRKLTEKGYLKELYDGRFEFSPTYKPMDENECLLGSVEITNELSIKKRKFEVWNEFDVQKLADLMKSFTPVSVIAKHLNKSIGDINSKIHEIIMENENFDSEPPLKKQKTSHPTEGASSSSGSLGMDTNHDNPSESSSTDESFKSGDFLHLLMLAEAADKLPKQSAGFPSLSLT